MLEGSGMDGVEASGSTVEEAIENALDELGAERDEVDIEVLNEDGDGARVRVALRAAVAADDDGDEDQDEREDDDDEGEDEDEDDEGDDDGEGEDEDGEEDVQPQPGNVRRERRRPDPVINEERLAAGKALLEQEGIDEAEFAARMLDKLLELMGIEGDVSIRDAETPGDGLGMANAVLDVEGDDLGILIGRRGETLGALQFLLNLMVAQQLGKQEFFTVDVEGYRRRREHALTQLARRMADQARRSGKPVTLEPMPAHERRIIHLTLSDHRYVSTSSDGEGEERRITIAPKR